VRPVNLIPPEERRGRTPIRTGPIAYLLVGALALALGAVSLVVLNNNKIADHEAKIADLRQQESATKARADQLAPFARFASVEQERTATIRSLADSRFDWERVMRELARIIPDDVWLTGLSGSVGGAATTSSSSSSSSAASGGSIDTSSIAGPSLALSGCAAGQEAVARFLAALRDIDGVTRVGLGSSDVPDAAASSSSSSSAAGGSAEDCTVRNFIAQFQIVAAFDAVPAPQIPAVTPSTSTTATAASSSAGSTETTPASDAAGTTSPGS
jgi:Tfp pilus assembly protein PilN